MQFSTPGFEDFVLTMHGVDRYDPDVLDAHAEAVASTHLTPRPQPQQPSRPCVTATPKSPNTTAATPYDR